MKNSGTKTDKYIILFLLLAIIVVFIHSEIVHQCHADNSHEQHDFCTIASNSPQPGQKQFPKSDLIFSIQPLIDKVMAFENIYPCADNPAYFPSLKVSVVLLLETLLF